MTCKHCGEVSDMYDVCSKCSHEYYEDSRRRCPPGLSQGALNFNVWSKLQKLERDAGAYGYSQEKKDRLLKKIVDEAEADYQKSLPKIKEQEEAKRAAKAPPCRLY